MRNLADFISVSKADSQKHLGLDLDSKLSFDVHIKTILTKANRTIELLQTFQQLLHIPSLIPPILELARPS